MKYNKKIIAAFMVVIILLCLSLIFYLKPEFINFDQIKKTIKPDLPGKNMAMIKTEYQNNIKAYNIELKQLFDEIDEKIISANLPDVDVLTTNQKDIIDKIEAIKKRAMDLHVPEEYKEFHVTNIFVLDQLRNFAIAKDIDYYDQAMELKKEAEELYDNTE